MKKIYFSLVMLLACFVHTACTNEVVNNEATNGEGKFVLSVLTEDVQIEDLTRNSEAAIDVNKFKVSLRDQNGIYLFTDKEYGQLSDGDRTLPTGAGYTISVESCSESEAESANEGWGHARFYADTTFTIVSDQTTALTLKCSMGNAGLLVVFDQTFISKFPTYAATTQGARSLVFKAANAGSVAYYNTSAEQLYVSLRLTGSAGGWSDRIDKVKDISLTKGKITRLTVKYDENSGDLDIEFGTDTDMGEGSDDVTIQ